MSKHSRSFFFSEKGNDVVTIYYGDPDKLGPEAEHVTTLHKSLFPALIADIKNYQQLINQVGRSK